MRSKTSKSSLVLFSACLLLASNIIQITAQASTDSKGKSAAQNALASAQACYSSFVKNIPPTFCYKKGADAGMIPSECPDGYFRSLALCYKNCERGFSFVAGVCWEGCADGFHDHGATCFKGIFNFYFKKTYMAQSKTNFEAPCPNGMYRGGALCYRDCNKIGLDNCGIGACASNSGVCGTTIATMALDFAMSMADSVQFVVSAGTSSAFSSSTSAAKSSLKQGLARAGKTAIQNAARSASQAIERITSKEFIKKMTTEAVKMVGSKVESLIIEQTCKALGDQLIGNLKQDNSNIDVELQSFDPAGISSAVNDCEDTSNEANALQCAKSVLQTIDVIDPTGIAGMAAAFMYPTCDV